MQKKPYYLTLVFVLLASLLGSILKWVGHFNNTLSNILLVAFVLFVLIFIYYYIPVVLKIKSKLYLLLMLVLAIFVGLIFLDYFGFLKSGSLIPSNL